MKIPDGLIPELIWIDEFPKPLTWRDASMAKKPKWPPPDAELQELVDWINNAGYFPEEDK